jgi:kinesin family protein 18/19
VRVRPLSAHEVAEGARSVVSVLNTSFVILLQPLVHENDFLRQGRVAEKRFAFDSVWDPDTSQDAIYQHSTQDLLAGVLDGFNATCFAYSAIGWGKTFTMSGTNQQQYVYRVSLSLLEVRCR